MQCRAFSAPKAGLPTDANEDAYRVSILSKRKAMITVADGASTGIFSRQWSNHLVNGIDEAALDSPEKFTANLSILRASFKPEVVRPSAQRKFLLEGSYATLMAINVQKSGWLFPKLSIRFFSVGDVTLMIFDTKGKLKFAQPYSSASEFNNAPHLIRSGEKLQEKTPLALLHGIYTADADDLIALFSDALGEMIFRTTPEGTQVLQAITGCASNDDFTKLMAKFREQKQMKNDDTTAVFLTYRPGLGDE